MVETPVGRVAARKALFGGPGAFVYRIASDGAWQLLSARPRTRSANRRSDAGAEQNADALPSKVEHEAMSLVTRTLQSGEPQSFVSFLTVDGDAREYQGMLIPTGKDDVFALVDEVSDHGDFEVQALQSQKLEAIGHLVGGVAHDFNNTLTAIMAHCELGMRNGRSAAVEGSLGEIQKVAERATGLCRQLLVFAGNRASEPSTVSLNETVANAHSILSRLIGEQIVLKTRAQARPDAVKADPGQLEQVLVNLAVNARDAMPHGGELTIDTSNAARSETEPGHYSEMGSGGYVRLSVRDTGSGIPDDVMPHIFEPFFTTKSADEGAGLGLFVCS